MTETITPKFKNFIDAIWNEISKPELEVLRKKVLALSLLVPAALIGISLAISNISYGTELLVNSGVSKILLMRIYGVLICFVGAWLFYFSCVFPGRVFNKIFNKPVDESACLCGAGIKEVHVKLTNGER